MIWSNSIYLFPLGCFAFTLLYCEVGQSTHPRWTFLMPLRHCLKRASWTLHCGTASRQHQQQNVSEVDLVQPGGETLHQHLCSSTHFLDDRQQTQNWGINEREGLNALLNLHRTKTTTHKGIVDIDKRSFGACCQAEYIEAICYSCRVGCVLTANETLQCSNEIKLRAPLLGYLSSAVSLRIKMRLLHHICPNELRQRWNIPLFWKNISGVTAPWDITFLCGVTDQPEYEVEQNKKSWILVAH